MKRSGVLATAASLGLVATLLSSCGGSDDALVWYTNPDTGGQAAVAAACSKKLGFEIDTQVLPQDAGQQRIQLARRLAAEDPAIDLMSIDPPYTAEFANAGYLAPIPDDMQQRFRDQAFDGAVEAATWDDQLVVAPFWSNTQVLWYRKSFADKAGIDMSQPVTWDQIIQAASKNGGTVAVQSNKYEGYAVWINALISGAGGEIATDTEKGADATIEVDSPAGEDAAGVIAELARSKAAPPDMSIAQEGQAGTTFGGDTGAFMVNWTYVLTGAGYPEDVVKDIGYTRYPQTVAGEESRPPYGGIGIGVSAYSDHEDEAIKALECITSPDNQGLNAELTGNMPSSPEGYKWPALKKIYPQDLLDLFQQSLDAAAPRTVTPYWSDISGALISRFHPPSSVDKDTPADAQKFIEDVLQQRSLL
ncbi:extracellular solute-binding protein [Nocardioides sp. MH1]|uniref:extracellular solute-binding protein n=1 Tax=Nocardioides sp. MH1 TaxID=3242490 RepID=UPI0035202A38